MSSPTPADVAGRVPPPFTSETQRQAERERFLLVSFAFHDLQHKGAPSPLLVAAWGAAFDRAFPPVSGQRMAPALGWAAVKPTGFARLILFQAPSADGMPLLDESLRLGALAAAEAGDRLVRIQVVEVDP